MHATSDYPATYMYILYCVPASWPLGFVSALAAQPQCKASKARVVVFLRNMLQQPGCAPCLTRLVIKKARAQHGKVVKRAV